MTEGCWGNLESTNPPVTFPAWKSFSTGMNPGKLGIFGHIQLENGKLIVCNSTTAKNNTEIWDHMSAVGKRVAVIGVPITYPPKPVNGIMVSGPFSVGHNYTYPSELEKTLEKKYNYDPFPEEFLLSEEKDIEVLIRNVKSKFDFLDDVVEKDYDLVCSVIFETDTAQHFLWRTKGLKKFWKVIDRRLNGLVTFIDNNPEYNLIMCSDHGFHGMKGALYLNEWLRKKGYLKLKGKFKWIHVLSKMGITSNFLYSMARRLRLLKILRKTFSPETLRKIGKTLPTKNKMILDQGIGSIIDMDRSRAFFVEGGIYIKNQRDKTKILKELSRLEDKDGIRYLDIKDKTDEYWGDYVDAAPDILVWSKYYSLRGHVSFEKRKELVSSAEEDKWVATHQKHGIFLAYGADIKKGKRVDAHIYDIAPTVLSMYGLKKSKEMDGEVIESIF